MRAENKVKGQNGIDEAQSLAFGPADEKAEGQQAKGEGRQFGARFLGEAPHGGQAGQPKPERGQQQAVKE